MKISREAAAAGFLTLVLAMACGEDGPSSAVGDGGAGGGETGADGDGTDATDSSDSEGPGPSNNDGDTGPGPNVPASTPADGNGGTGPEPSTNGGEANLGGSSGSGGENQGGNGNGGAPVGVGGAGSAGDSGNPGGAAGNGAGGSGTDNGGAGGMPPEVCVTGNPCAPADPCHQGTLDCSTLEPTCIDMALPAADGTPCGEDQVCRTGLCQSCVEGQSCTLDDPCAVGETSCALGIEECVPVGSRLAMGSQCAGDFTAADVSDDGFCSSDGVCECPAGTAYSQGQCAPCPDFAVSILYVNADPAVGLDNHCCGRTTTAGFGGPCRTVSAAMTADSVTDKTISITPTATGDVSPAEVYPWRPGPNFYISSYSGDPVCVPGTSGEPVVVMETGSVTLADLLLGASCEGVASGASVGIQVGPGGEGNEPRVILYQSNIDGPDIGALILPNAVLENVYSSGFGATPVKVSNSSDVGIQVDGGTLYGYFEVAGPAPIGVLCRSDSDPAQPSNLGTPTGDPTGINVSGASEYDVLASMNCRTPRPISMGLGSGRCETPTWDRFGLYAEGDAQVVLSEATFRCFQQDGITLRHNPELPVNAPQVEVSNGYLGGAACAAAYVEVGFLRIYETRFAANHWGAVQRSNQSSPASSLLNLSGQFEAMDLPNEFYCNGQIAAPSCDGPGGDVWNNSGLDLDASFNDWPEFPLSQCNCDEALSSCSCVGAAFGETTPPAGISTLGSPFQSSIVGSINVSDAAARIASECPPY